MIKELEKTQDESGKKIFKTDKIQEWFNNETYYSNPRRIEMGIRYDF